MSVDTAETATRPDPPPIPSRRASHLVMLVTLVGVLAALILLGFFVGSGSFSISEVWHALLGQGDATTLEVIRNNRVPRTLLAVLVGAALGAAGAIMQSLTRNPLADPGILGVNSGAYFAMVVGAVVFGITTTSGYLWFAMAGAFLAATIVYFVGSRGVSGASPEKLVLTGVAAGSIFSGVGFGLTMIDPKSFDTIRSWQVGTLDGRGWEEVTIVWLPICLGCLVSMLLIPYLNGLALGDDRARSLGIPVGRVRAAGFVIVTVLCGAATAAIGPITFVGLMVPQTVRLLFGPDNRWLLPMSVIVGPIVLVGSDLLARVITPSELPVGMVTAFIGAPVLIALVRRKGAET
ncbi:FecCD family ABC transporter permease [Gordonia insulae]|uniref:Ferric enterobactin transport system permease protein FepD n=1 Tax=Gordonia insulae TaxID=2420509 RepID=A0A3G8JIS3_9ACTN|nr:iron chelate uptake ABC transporter family permease subunit [Gordonia insulae]AZG44495.1 Ferric enterobactin transport system permease protein FepD [Gordonia insulae]